MKVLVNPEVEVFPSGEVEGAQEQVHVDEVKLLVPDP